MAQSVAVVGSGIAGLACALALERAGCRVSVFDKGRAAGGRVATRRSGDASFNHGAQYATARSPAFHHVMSDLQAAGVAAPWEAAEDGDIWWVGLPGMSAIPRHLAMQLAQPPRQGRHVAFLRESAEGWTVRHLAADATRPGVVVDEGGELAGPFEAVLLALPSPQAAPLLAALGHEFAARAATTRYAPCWAAMSSFAERVDAPDAQRRRDGGPLGWVARENSRPGHPDEPDSWALHASAEWSRANLERDAEAVATDLAAAFQDLTGAPAPTHLAAQRWRYALVEQALGEPCLWDSARRIGACGDWCLGGRVEAAFSSGEALAAAVMGSP